jgi:hypothetical protein
VSSQPDLPPLSEPPVSPLQPDTQSYAPLVPEPDQAAPATKTTLEAQLLRLRLIGPDQMAEAMRVEDESGKPVAETVVERGWVSPGDLESALASLGEPYSPLLEPLPAEPTAPDEPPPGEPELDLPPAASGGHGVRVLVRLHDGTELAAGSYEATELARQRARQLVEEIQSEDAWVFVAGRPVTPVDVDRIYLDR